MPPAKNRGSSARGVGVRDVVGAPDWHGRRGWIGGVEALSRVNRDVVLAPLAGVEPAT